MTPGRVQFRVGQSERGHETALRVLHQDLRLLPANCQFISIEESAIIVIEAKSVTGGVGHLAIALTQEKQVAVFDNERVCDAATNRGRTPCEFPVFQFDRKGADSL